jgi:hypothetical protein
MASASQMLKEALDRYLMMSNDRFIISFPPTIIDDLAYQIVATGLGKFGPPDMSMMKYLIDRLLGRAAVSADIALATPQDLERACDVSLKDYAKDQLQPIKPASASPLPLPPPRRKNTVATNLPPGEK